MKNVIIGTVLAIGAMFILSGCGEEEPKTIAYYKAHLDEAKAVRVECKAKKENGAFDGQSPLAPTPEMVNCYNAQHAIMFSSSKPIRGDEPVQKTW
jgi:hypothetical protein